MEIRLSNVSKSYGNFNAVSNLDLIIPSASLHFLLGPSGCGKSTTLRMIAGLEAVSQGSIFFGNKNMTDVPAAERGIGMVFQNYALWPHMTVRENILFGLKLKRLSKSDISDRLDEALSMTRLTPFAERFPSQLSGGQQQRVALARALAIRPFVLLLDEPLSNLDAKLRYEMRENIASIHSETKLTMIYVTHDQKEALSLGSSITVMHAGKQVQSGSPHKLYSKPESPFLASFIGETNLISGRVKEIDSDALSIETELGLLECKTDLASVALGEPLMLSVRPESIHLLVSAEKGSSKRNQCSDLTLTKSIYLGDSEQLEFSYGKKSTLRVNVVSNGWERFQAPEFIHCEIDPENIVVMRPDLNLATST